MPLITFKWLAAFIILALSLTTGIASLRFAVKFQRQLQIGDAAANGIFIGAAIFHLFPAAIEGFHNVNVSPAYLITLFLIILIIAILFIIDHITYKLSQHKNVLISVWLLTLTLSVHALIAGISLGISETFAIVSIIFFAILAHKGFEMFAFVINLHRRLQNYYQVMLLFFLFSFITPLGIWIGTLSDNIFRENTDNLLTACFNAIAAGTFLYIGIIDRHHTHYRPVLDSYQQYTRVLATLIGILVMSIVAIWV